ncbi:MAG: ABC transporter permease [Sandaracinaceae bacterium]|nr:ABC transporter permease [Sandaracinaceae bacterium]
MSDNDVDEASEPAPPEADEAKPGVPRDPGRAVGAAAQEEPRPPSFVVASLTRLLASVTAPLAEVGALARMLAEVVFWGLVPVSRSHLHPRHGVRGCPVHLHRGHHGLLRGRRARLQLVNGFRDLGVESQTGSVVGFALAREIGPVFTALMVSSRAGSAMTTELGSMRVTNQIDALITMAVNPVQYLVVPRVLAGLLMVPILTIFFDVIGMTGAWLVCTKLLGLDSGVFLDRMRWIVDWRTQLGLTKSAVFGVTVCLIACRQGFYATGGAAGVGQATNRSVVHNAIAILLLDYLVTGLVLGEGLG